MGPLPFDEQDEEKEESGASDASTAEDKVRFTSSCSVFAVPCIQCVRHNTTLALFCCIDGCAKVGNINFGLKLYTSFPKWETIVAINIFVRCAI